MAKKDFDHIFNTFLDEETPLERQNRRRSLIATSMIFAGLVVVFFFASLTSPEEEEGLKGIEVMMGEEMAGFQEDDFREPEQPDATDEEIEEEPQEAEDEIEQEEVTEPEETETEEHAVEDIESDPVEDPATEEDELAEEMEEEQEEKEREVDSLALYDGPAEEPAGEEETGEDPGDPEGAEDTGSPEDHGLADEEEGMAYDLGGRQMSRAPDVDDETQKTGTVVVQISVDRQGNVTHARPGARGSTTNDPELLEIARQSALDTEFEPDPDAPEEHRGVMEFNFRLE